MPNTIYQQLCAAQQKNKKQLAVLLDPDDLSQQRLDTIIGHAQQAAVDYFFVGGSLVMTDKTDVWVRYVKQQCTIPVVLFPGSVFQVTPNADALLFLSLISGRNPELLIGQHVMAAPILRQMSLEIMPTGYLLIDGGQATTVSYISNSSPIPSDKAQIAACTAMAGEMLGLKIMYLDSGSGALRVVPPAMIAAVRKYVQTPIIVGGGIRNPQQAVQSCKAGADLIVVGNAIEKNPTLVYEMAAAIHKLNN